jgi:hypothetical protein
VIAPNDKSAATEVTTPPFAGAPEASRDRSVEESNGIAARAVARFRLFLADAFPTEAELERYRAAQATDFEDLCVECKVYPARLQCRCMTCLARRGAA